MQSVTDYIRKYSMPIYGVLYPIQITCSIAFAQRTFPPSEFAPSEQERVRITTEPPAVHDNPPSFSHTHLSWEGLLDILLHSAQEKGLQLLVQRG